MVNHSTTAYDIQENKWTYIKMNNPRGGLLANIWTSTEVLGTDAPMGHTSHVHGSELVLLGGKHDTSLKMVHNNRLQNDQFNKMKIQWSNGSSLDTFSSNACSVKINKDRVLILGGTENGRTQSRVLDINLKLETVEEWSSLQLQRARHSCAMASNTSVLVSGGVSDTSKPGATLVPDELYNIYSGETQVLNDTMTQKRFDHSLIRLGESIFALGGEAANGSSNLPVEMFVTNTSTWTPHPKGLLSASTGGLAVAALPKSAVDCINECPCGVAATKGTRIVNGTESLPAAYPWVGLLLKKDVYGEDDPKYSDCSATLVHT